MRVPTASYYRQGLHRIALGRNYKNRFLYDLMFILSNCFYKALPEIIKKTFLSFGNSSQ